MSCHGVHRICGLTIAYVMLANARQNEFKLTVKEQKTHEIVKMINGIVFKGKKEDLEEKTFAHTIVDKHKL